MFVSENVRMQLEFLNMLLPSLLPPGLHCSNYLLNGWPRPLELLVVMIAVVYKELHQRPTMVWLASDCHTVSFCFSGYRWWSGLKMRFCCFESYWEHFCLCSSMVYSSPFSNFNQTGETLKPAAKSSKLAFILAINWSLFKMGFWSSLKFTLQIQILRLRFFTLLLSSSFANRAL